MRLPAALFAPKPSRNWTRKSSRDGAAVVVVEVVGAVMDEGDAVELGGRSAVEDKTVATAVSSSVVTGDACGAGRAGSSLSLSDEHADATSTEISTAASAVKIFVFIAENLLGGYIFRSYKGRFSNHRQPAAGSLC